MMKKSLRFIFVIVFMVLLLTGCGSEDSSKEPKNGETKTSEKTKSNKINEKVNIDEKVLLDKDDIKITAKSINYNGFMGPEIKLLIENNSDENITVQTRDFSINDIMLDPSFSADVAAGKKANDSILLYESDLKTAKITNIKDIEFTFYIYESDSWDDIMSEEGIVLTTDAKDFEQEYNKDGFLAVDKNGVKVYVLKLDDKDSFWGADVKVYVENNSNRPIMVQARDVSINGFMVDPSFSVDVGVGKKAYSSMTFFESDLEENDIKDITELELKFSVIDQKSWDTIFKTEDIKVEF